ncbi:Hsp33 family molecular chaperone HslO [Pokkaliibacter sp. CJK22405]|uniref:Hsp33 family molecular chaperone HslO n=1 Tax=Pokkaliibacter sp. CJK22405 TaxID=3384615 RepID=UPI003985682D
MSNPDQIQRFLFDDISVRGAITGLQSTYQEVLSRDAYPRPVQTLLGQMLAACSLMSTVLKFEGRLVIQARTAGALRVVQAECSHLADLRGIARWDGDIADDLDPMMLLQEGGQMAITIEPEKGRPYQGIVPLEGATLAECMQGYFNQSEQLPCRLFLAADGKDAAGMMLQAVPESSGPTDVADLEDWERLTVLADTLTSKEMLELDNTTVLTRLFHEEQVRVFPVLDLRFHCDCSKERCSAALATLNAEDLNDAIQQDEELKVQCQFCNEEYVFDKADLEALQHEASAPGNPDVLH